MTLIVDYTNTFVYLIFTTFNELFLQMTFNLLKHGKTQDMGITWSSLFGLIAWRIWKNRNLFVFQNISWTAFEIIKVSLSWGQQLDSYIRDSKVTALSLIIQTHSGGRWVHLFTDGAVANISGKAFAGELSVIKLVTDCWALVTFWENAHILKQSYGTF